MGTIIILLCVKFIYYYENLMLMVLPYTIGTIPLTIGNMIFILLLLFYYDFFYYYITYTILYGFLIYIINAIISLLSTVNPIHFYANLFVLYTRFLKIFFCSLLNNTTKTKIPNIFSFTILCYKQWTLKLSNIYKPSFNFIVLIIIITKRNLTTDNVIGSKQKISSLSGNNSYFSYQRVISKTRFCQLGVSLQFLFSFVNRRG